MEGKESSYHKGEKKKHQTKLQITSSLVRLFFQWSFIRRNSYASPLEETQIPKDFSCRCWVQSPQWHYSWLCRAALWLHPTVPLLWSFPGASPPIPHKIRGQWNRVWRLLLLAGPVQEVLSLLPHLQLLGCNPVTQQRCFEQVFSQHKYNICNDFYFLASLLLPAALQILYGVTVDWACLSLLIGFSIWMFHFCTRCHQSTCLSRFLDTSSHLGENTFLFCLKLADPRILFLLLTYK